MDNTAEKGEVAEVKCGTSAGDITIEFHRSWSPHGYDRAVELFEKGTPILNLVINPYHCTVPLFAAQVSTTTPISSVQSLDSSFSLASATPNQNLFKPLQKRTFQTILNKTLPSISHLALFHMQVRCWEISKMFVTMTHLFVGVLNITQAVVPIAAPASSFSR